MNRFTVLWRSLVLAVLGLCVATSGTVAQDMAKVAPEIVTVLLENDHVRVLDVNAKAGNTLPMHSHPGYVLYSFSDGNVRTTLADGKTSDTEFKAGEARWSEPIIHANEALSETHVLVIEVKKPEMMKKMIENKTIKKD